MAKLLLGNISDIKDAEMTVHFRKISMFSNEILKYRFEEDRKSRVLARLMLLYCLNEDGCSELIHMVKRDEHNKPYIRSWKPFSISHSCEIVAFGFDNYGIGIDIEKRSEIDYLDISKLFHHEEQVFIENAADTQKAFYEVWVKKEAFLKAIGIGFVDSLDKFNCSADIIQYNWQKWKFHEVPVPDEYTCYICTPSSSPRFELTHFKI